MTFREDNHFKHNNKMKTLGNVRATYIQFQNFEQFK